MRIPDHIELAIDESVTYKGRNLLLKQVVPEYDRYYQGRWYSILRRARVQLLIDGQDVELICAPYQLPTRFNGLVLQADLVQAQCGGAYPEPLSRELRLAIMEGDESFYSDCDWVFPVREYQWRSAVTRSHTWNGFVQIDNDEIYYHRGEDFAVLPDQLDVLSVGEGSVESVPPSNGDGSSNVFEFRYDGLLLRAAHMNPQCFNLGVQTGNAIAKGAAYGKTGNTWQGRATVDPHFHLEIRTPAGNRLNTWPLLLQAYRNTWPSEPLAMGGGFRFCSAGETLALSATGSLAPETPLLEDGNTDADFTWIFCDGTVQRGHEAAYRYASPGTWTEILKMSTADGRIAYDFITVRVSAEGATPPFAFFSAGPMRRVKPGIPVQFWIHGIDLDEASLDFGDGKSQPVHPQSNPVEGRDMITHKYSHSGVYIAELSGRSDDGLPGIFKLPVYVEENGS